MKIYVIQSTGRVSMTDFSKRQSSGVQIQLQKLVDEIEKTGTLKTRSTVDSNGPGEWRIKLADEKNVLSTFVIGLESTPSEQKALERKLFKGSPGKTRWIEIKRLPSEIETRFNDREPYTIDTWTVEEYAQRLPANLQALFTSTIEKLRSGQSANNVKQMKNDEIEINLSDRHVTAVWKMSSLPKVP